MDILETENELLLKADLPGVDMKNIDIQVENGTLTLKGQREFQNEAKQGGYHRIERSYGSFVRYSRCRRRWTRRASGPISRTASSTVTLPKKEVAKPRRIKVQVTE